MSNKFTGGDVGCFPPRVCFPGLPYQDHRQELPPTCTFPNLTHVVDALPKLLFSCQPSCLKSSSQASCDFKAAWSTCSAKSSSLSCAFARW